MTEAMRRTDPLARWRTLGAQPPPGHVPAGWSTELDEQTLKWYYYNETTGERSWFRPNEVAHKTAARLSLMGVKGFVKEGEKADRRGAVSHLLWAHESFRTCYVEACAQLATGKALYLKRALEEVYESNKLLSKQKPSIAVKTSVVPFADCVKALQDGTLEEVVSASKGPKVSISERPIGEALYAFASGDSYRTVCGLNWCSGKHLAGSFVHGGLGQEEDLCRRLPLLYDSLEAVNCSGQFVRHHLQPGQEDTMCDVLYTPSLKVSRTSAEEGFRILPEREQPTVSLVTAREPNIPGQSLDAKLEMLEKSVAAIFAAPVLKNARTTTLVIGFYACGVDGHFEATDVAEAFAKAMKLHSTTHAPLRMGGLYLEIHFAFCGENFKKSDDHGTAVAETFRTVFSKHGIRFVEM
eukprot:TRINITY_DN12632_c0_g3_i3.p1 TRINITY_DN12632_c0_g3~~TRINITY_DN12632_c0_g3_i3.p1  ORF type:complete len:410 (+),score=93.91 TRINITY_DN12632_c0_g3_i3:220-1449(+)